MALVHREERRGEERRGEERRGRCEGLGDVRERGKEVNMRKIIKEDFLGGLGERERWHMFLAASCPELITGWQG